MSDNNAFTKASLKRFVGFVAFIFIATHLLLATAYISRNTSDSRFNIVGIKSENNLDMVYIGGSAAYDYWQPLRAWSDCGFTSYTLATSSIQLECIKSYIQWSEQYQDPDIYVIDARPLQYFMPQEYENGPRNGADSMDFLFPGRFSLLNRYFKYRIIDPDTDVLSYYIDISKYHSNVDNWGSQEAWELIDNERVNHNKGFVWDLEYTYLEEPVGFQTDLRSELSGDHIELLNELFDYSNSLDKEFLFVVCPYVITEQEQQDFNTIEDMIDSRGFEFLNTNEYYDEMGIDFATDFLNGWHVNTFGASKYTVFLGGYICDHYNLPDHRSDPEYSSWNDAATRFFEEDLIYQAQLIQFRRDYEAGILPEDDQE